MSWESYTKRVKCPCGKGYITQEEESDDWGRTRRYTPIIDCPDCASKYEVEETHSFCCKWDGDGISYYLTSKGYPKYSGVTEEDYFPAAVSNIFQFNEWFTENYPKEQLQFALNEFCSTRSSSTVASKLARKIVYEHKYVFKTVKVSEIIPRLREIISAYDTYNGNYDQRKIIRDEEQKQRAVYTEEKRKYQIRLAM